MGLVAVQRDIHLRGIGLSPQTLQAQLAKVAKKALAAAQSEGSAPPTFTRHVNGREGAPEESVILPGPILYLFSWLTEVAQYALAFAEARSPSRSGRYKRSWFAMVNGRVVTDFSAIPPNAELIITNDQPYSRKIEIGKTESGRAFVVQVAPGIVQDTRQAVLRRFGNTVTAEVRFISLAGAYALRRGSRRPRKGRRAGDAVTYPALVVNTRSQ